MIWLANIFGPMLTKKLINFYQSLWLKIDFFFDPNQSDIELYAWYVSWKAAVFFSYWSICYRLELFFAISIISEIDGKCKKVSRELEWTLEFFVLKEQQDWATRNTFHLETELYLKFNSTKINWSPKQETRSTNWSVKIKPRIFFHVLLQSFAHIKKGRKKNDITKQSCKLALNRATIRWISNQIASIIEYHE